MKQFQIRYENRDDFENKLHKLKESCEDIEYSVILFYLTWTMDGKPELEGAVDLIKNNFPDADYYGNEAAGFIAMGDFARGIHVTCYIFEEKDTKVELAWVQQGTALSTLEDLWAYCNTRKGLRAIELIPSMPYLEALKIDCNVPDISEDILIFGGGGAEYDVTQYDADVIATGHERTTDGMAVALYFGENLLFSSNSIHGWKGLGRFMEVTDSDGKNIKKIDNDLAYSIYEKYLNLSMEDQDTLVFPLIVNEDGIEYLRTPRTVLPDKSLQMFVDIPLGTKLRISYGDKNTILDGIYAKAIDIAKSRPAAIKAFSCTGRRLFWGDDEVGRETMILQEIAPVCGSYTGGEILRFGKVLRVLNQTLDIITFSEEINNRDSKKVELKTKSPDKSLVSRLAFFSQKVSEEQEEVRRLLEEDKNLLRESMKVIGGLAEEYMALFYVNMDEGTYKVYSVDEARLSKAKSLLYGINVGSSMLKKFGNSEFVYPDDRHLFDDIGVDSIRERLSHSKKFTIRYRHNFNGEYLWSEMDVIKYEAIDERANEIAIGFAERDAEIRSEQALNNCFNVLGKELSPYDAIEELLSSAGEFYNAERCYIFEFSANKDTFTNTYEWCAEGIDAMISFLQDIPMKEIDGWINEFKRHGAFYMDALDSEHNTEEGIEILKMQGIESLIAAPLMNGDEIVGFVGVDNPSKAKKNITVLKNVAVVSYSEILKRKENDEEHVTLDKLADTFLSVYYADLSRDYIHTWKLDSDYEGTYEAAQFYSESMGGYVRNYIAESDRERCIKMTSPEYVIEQFKTKDRFSIDMTDIMLGHERDVVFDYVKVNDEGTQMVICCRDVTERLAKEREQQKMLQDALDAADNANKSKTRFLFNMSHDIRTPMNAIIGFTNMAIKYIEDTEKATDCLSKIQQSGNMLLSLINSVLEVSRIESGNATLEEQFGDVKYSFVNIESTLLELAEVKDIDLTFEFGEITDRYVLCDFNRCMRVFVNVISNAIKYTREGGYVRVKCEQAEKAKNGMAWYRYTVEDNGIGMSEEYQKHIFEQFSREKTATASGIQGTGLGMAVCKSYVDLMGGTIEFTSEQGKGTTFIITLPFKLQTEEKYVDPVTGLVRTSEEEPEIVSKDKDTFFGKKVLLVEDNELNREIATDILEEDGLVVESAEDGTVAVDVMRRKGPDYYDFVLMDIQMPIMNGYDATKAIREMYPDAGIPIIALSANAFSEDREKSLAAGMDDHVAKPINVEALFKVLLKYI